MKHKNEGAGVTNMPDWMMAVGNIGMGFLAWVMVVTGLPVAPGVILAFIMFLDFLSALAKCYVMETPITSRKLKSGILSKVLMLLVPVVLALTASAIGIDLVWFVTWVLNLLILGEAYSFLSNVHAVKYKKDLPEWNVLAMITHKLRNIVEDGLKEGSSKK